jgi:hypothetical protein
VNQKTRKEQRAKVKFDDMPRGKQVEYLMKPEDKGGEGMNAQAVADDLGISRNAVYQQIRKNRIRKSGGSTAKKSGGSTAKKSGGSTRKAATSGRKSGGTAKRTPAPAPAAPPAPTPTLDVGNLTPEEIIGARLKDVGEEITGIEAQIQSLTVSLDGDGKDQPGLRAEQSRLSRALAALKGEPVESGQPLLTPTEGEGKGEGAKASGQSRQRPGSRAKAKREEAKGGGNGSAPAEAPAPAAAESTTPPAAAAAAPAGPPADDPFEGQGEGAEADAAQAAAEAPQA